MDWTVGRAILLKTEKLDVPYFLKDGSGRPKCWRPHKKGHRAGAKRSRATNPIRCKDPNVITIFFANVTRMSEKAKHKVISRGDDVLLVTENSLHCRRERCLE